MPERGAQIRCETGFETSLTIQTRAAVGDDEFGRQQISARVFGP
jgi:hypothetical protein